MLLKAPTPGEETWLLKPAQIIKKKFLKHYLSSDSFADRASAASCL